MVAHQHSPAPKWQTPDFRHQSLSPALKNWLYDPRSLTQKLLARSKGQFRVEVLDQRIQRVLPSEYRILSLPHRRWAVVREVLLYGKQQPWVYARTIIPLSTLKGPLRRLHYLGNRPLGAAIFADPSLRRQAFEIAHFRSEHLPPRQRKLKPSWGRRSVFVVKGKKLLVGETFLAPLMDSLV